MNSWRLECEHVKQAISASELYFGGSNLKWWGRCKSLRLYNGSIESRGSVNDTTDSVSRGKSKAVRYRPGVAQRVPES
jgi:hypothetical protein